MRLLQLALDWALPPVCTCVFGRACWWRRRRRRRLWLSGRRDVVEVWVLCVCSAVDCCGCGNCLWCNAAFMGTDPARHLSASLHPLTNYLIPCGFVSSFPCNCWVCSTKWEQANEWRNIQRKLNSANYLPVLNSEPEPRAWAFCSHGEVRVRCLSHLLEHSLFWKLLGSGVVSRWESRCSLTVHKQAQTHEHSLEHCTQRCGF